MKITCIFFLFALLGADASLAQRRLREVNDPFTIKDGVFIVNDKASDYYESITDFKIDGSKKKFYKEALGQIPKERGHALKKHNRLGLPQNWVQMVYYEGKYYPYYHSLIGDERLQINDSTRVDYFADGPLPVKVIDIKRISPLHYELVWGYDDNVWEVNIYIIDKENQIAVFDYGDKETTYRYNLMVNADSVKKFPIMVSYVSSGLQQLVSCDSVAIDYKKMIASCGK